ncbi:hypothetical protein HNP84_000854 [Thermocatellispora tengchongensis]|uniref:Lipoprotein n=1 Tax=Thermocatellispora tengchongensis TaxID=1073253 RepID=A0A840NUB0_9ACTN|nr:hypothetical protein [Thermocatellispora tengchongensis]MBB5131148.1 hypothetical protein [Thermocatellispora tengchongensis]
MERSRARLAVAVLTAVMVTVALSGCGGSQFTYVRDDDGNTYFKIPSSWRKVDQQALDTTVFGDQSSATAQLENQLSWTVAYDAHERPEPTHLLGGAEDEPFVFAKVQKLLPEESNQASLDTLRNAVGIPVAVPDETRKQLEETPGIPFKGFELLADEVLPQRDGIRGVRVIYNYRVGGGPVQTFDQTAYLGQDGTTVHVMLLRCSAQCYKKRAEEFDVIAKSFTVKGQIG